MVSGSSEKALLYKELLSEQNQAYMVFQRFDSFTFRVLVLVLLSVLVLRQKPLTKNLHNIANDELATCGLESPFTFWKETARASPDSVTFVSFGSPAPRNCNGCLYNDWGRGEGGGVFISKWPTSEFNPEVQVGISECINPQDCLYLDYINWFLHVLNHGHEQCLLNMANQTSVVTYGFGRFLVLFWFWLTIDMLPFNRVAPISTYES